MEQVKNLWQRHCEAEFPSECYDPEAFGIDLVLLDATVAGIVSTFLNQGQRLHSQQCEVLNLCRHELSVVVPALVDDGRTYFANLKELADFVANNA